MSRLVSTALARTALSVMHLRQRLAAAAGVKSIANGARNKKEMALLRRVLRSSPRWLKGHLCLAHCEVEALHRTDGKKDLRSVACIRVSARAALALLRGVSESEPRFKLEALYLLAMSDFFEGKLEPALAGLEQVIKSPASDSLSGKCLYRALEYAAAAAMPLGRRDEALTLIERIPTERRNPELVAAYKMLSDRSLG